MGRTNFSHQNSENESPRLTLTGLQRKLKRTEAVLSFHCGVRETYLWALTSDTLEVRFLPGKREIEKAVTDYREALLSHNPAAYAKGEHISAAILSKLSRTVSEKKDWILSLDGPLFELPFAALPVAGMAGRYLGQAHSLRTVPRAPAGTVDPDSACSNKFVAIADARYNAADPRWEGKAPLTAAGSQLARLPGSAREAAACARAWGRDPSPAMLSGAAVNRASVLQALNERPAVLHIAAHVVVHPQDPEQVLIALGLQPHSFEEYLSPAEIAAGRRRIGVVILSGCGSGLGAALPGLGLFGLTRAWLVSGATAVVATHWPVSDSNGEVLAELYAQLRENPGPVTASGVARALQMAQIRMTEARDWRADPAYWSAFMVAGKD